MTTYEMVAKQNEALAVEISNALVKQKDAILAALNGVEDAKGLRRAKEMLDLVRPVWEACEYGYKVKEVAERLMTAAEYLIIGQEEFLLTLTRKNDKLRRPTEGWIRELSAFRDEIEAEYDI